MTWHLSHISPIEGKVAKILGTHLTYVWELVDNDNQKTLGTKSENWKTTISK